MQLEAARKPKSNIPYLKGRQSAMTDTSKMGLRSRTNLHNFFYTVKAGIYAAVAYPVKRALLMSAMLMDLLLCIAAFWPRYLIPALYGFTLFVAFFVFTFLALLIFAAVGYIPGALTMYQNFQRVGFVNSAGEAPFLIRKQKLPGGVVALTFRCVGFPIYLWKDKQVQLESALNMRIASIHEEKDRRTITLYCVPSDRAFEVIPWNDAYARRNEDEYLILGRSLIGDVTLNLNKTPHILIGGNTGSGKTVLLQCLLWQTILQADVVYVADFKGGVDFSKSWPHFVHLVTDENQLLDLLDRLSAELDRRKALLVEAGAANITEYRKETGHYMQRVIFACDEIAELLDKTGADKDRKDLLAKIEARLSLIARQGRAFGIHLILCTQRPDANILPGQIKNNMSIRICGRADATLSTIILGDGSAAEQIPPDAQGRFLMDDGTLFQGFDFHDPSDDSQDPHK